MQLSSNNFRAGDIVRSTIRPLQASKGRLQLMETDSSANDHDIGADSDEAFAQRRRPNKIDRDRPRQQ
jgi:hypothetical protein